MQHLTYIINLENLEHLRTAAPFVVVSADDFMTREDGGYCRWGSSKLSACTDKCIDYVRSCLQRQWSVAVVHTEGEDIYGCVAAYQHMADEFGVEFIPLIVRQLEQSND
jgi:hypothetical protein